MRNGEELKGTADVVVVGGGVVGLSVARALARRGLSVALIERGEVGREASHAAGGMLAPQSEADRDDAFFRLQCAGRDLYPAFAESLLAETGHDIELERTGTLYLAFTDEDEAELERRYTWQRGAGLPVERLTPSEALTLEPTLSTRLRFALRFPLDWQVENRRLVRALSAAARVRGVRIYEGTEVTALRVERGRVVGVELAGGTHVGAGCVVVAAGAWSSRLSMSEQQSSQETHPRIEPVRGQMLCFAPHAPHGSPTRGRHVVYTRRGYVVPRLDGRILAGSTTERVGFNKLVTAGGVRDVLAHALEISPALAALELSETWAGLRPCAEDEWPVIGASGEVEGLYYATGHYRNGILLAPLTGELLAALIVEGARPADAATFSAHELDAFSPARFRHAFATSHGE
ncbi:MAG TPA: glycine oxidase ThiO [Pyrinomonadaceae bacterium]|nr:glycine oxidase ThiO [Pyrinomonadaceae bacterium]